MIRVTYYYSACVGIRTPELGVLCDPWFTEGAYDGSWYQFPRLGEPLETIGFYPWIYVSHIHPDHYDPAFLRSYLGRHPEAKVIIAPFRENWLARRMAADGIPHQVLHDTLRAGSSALKIFPNEADPGDIDSALAVTRAGRSVVNMNDNAPNASQLASIREFCAPEVTIALLGYTGAGPYPQTYYDDPEVLRQKAAQKKEQFFGRYRELQAALRPRASVPFAGQYVLGGKLWRLNASRGVADATEVASFDPTAVVLADGGAASMDTDTLSPSAVRTVAYPESQVMDYARSTERLPMRYEQYFAALPAEAIPWRRILPKAYANAIRQSRCEEPHWFCIRLPGNWFAMNVAREKPESAFLADVAAVWPRSEITIDYRYLFGLLSGLFHWNNAEVGSQYLTRRVPDTFRREVQGFLNFFHL